MFVVFKTSKMKIEGYFQGFERKKKLRKIWCLKRFFSISLTNKLSLKTLEFLFFILSRFSFIWIIEFSLRKIFQINGKKGKRSFDDILNFFRMFQKQNDCSIFRNQLKDERSFFKKKWTFCGNSWKSEQKLHKSFLFLKKNNLLKCSKMFWNFLKNDFI